MNQMADIVPKTEDPVSVTSEEPTEETHGWIENKLETWEKKGQTALDMGRGIMFTIMIINAAAALLFLAVGATATNPQVAAALNGGVELCLIGLGAATVANLAGFLMQKSVIQSATLNLIETWRNLGNE